MRSILANVNNEETRLLGIRSQDLKDAEIITYRTILLGEVIATILGNLIAFFTALSITKLIKMLSTSTENITKHNYKQSNKAKHNGRNRVEIINSLFKL